MNTIINEIFQEEEELQNITQELQEITSYLSSQEEYEFGQAIKKLATMAGNAMKRRVPTKLSMQDDDSNGRYRDNALPPQRSLLDKIKDAFTEQKQRLINRYEEYQKNAERDRKAKKIAKVFDKNSEHLPPAPASGRQGKIQIERGLKKELRDSVLGEIFLEQEGPQRMKPGKGMQFHDPVSQTKLNRAPLNSGTTRLQKAGLTRVKGDDGAYNFIDNKGRIRAKWIPPSGQEPSHWSKFEPSGYEKHYLNDGGRPVTGTDNSHRIPSAGGTPGTTEGIGAPKPVRREINSDWYPSYLFSFK